MLSTTQPGPLGILPPEVTYADKEILKAAMKDHGRSNGYAIKIETSDKNRVIYKCSKSGKYDSKGKGKDVDELKRCRNTGTIKTDCPFSVTSKLTDTGGWKVHVNDGNHNHEAVTSISTLLQYRISDLWPKTIAKIKHMNASGIPACQILSSLTAKDPNLVLIPRDVYNILA
jgi:hypothetical protein